MQKWNHLEPVGRVHIDFNWNITLRAVEMDVLSFLLHNILFYDLIKVLQMRLHCVLLCHNMFSIWFCQILLLFESAQIFKPSNCFWPLCVIRDFSFGVNWGKRKFKIAFECLEKILVRFICNIIIQGINCSSVFSILLFELFASESAFNFSFCSEIFQMSLSLLNNL